MTAQTNPSTSSPSPTADRELTSTRIFNAPRDLVWKTWTDPNHLTQWWGPRGFTTSTYTMDVKPGGVWRFVMHGPDGTDYQNKITYVEVVEGQRLAYKHGGEGEPVDFTVTVTFEDAGPGKTRLAMRMLFPSAAAKQATIDKYGADKGLRETMDRLGEKLTAAATGPGPFVISRTFDAPRELVWKAWTEREHLMRWFGPKGMPMTQAALDFRPGGTFHYCLRMPDGRDLWGKFIYREITPPHRIVMLSTFSDKDGGLGRHPLAPEWPQQMLNTTTFGEVDGKTIVTVQSEAYQATPSEQKTFDAGHPSMTNGWGGTLDQLGAFLASAR